MDLAQKGSVVTVTKLMLVRIVGSAVFLKDRPSIDNALSYLFNKSKKEVSWTDNSNMTSLVLKWAWLCRSLGSLAVTLAIAQGFRVRVASIYVQESVPNGETIVKKTKERGKQWIRKISAALCIGRLCQNETAQRKLFCTVQCSN